MTINEMIRKLEITLTMHNGQEALRIPSYKKPTKKQLAEIKGLKAEIIAEIKRQEAEEKAEREAKEKATVRFIVVGWESHEVTVDTRYDIDEQIRKIADYYSDDMTYESAKKAYEKAIGKEAEKVEREAKAKSEREAIFAKAKVTGEKQVIRHYMADCNDPKEQCSTDIVYEYAMPDGTTKVESRHTW